MRILSEFKTERSPSRLSQVGRRFQALLTGDAARLADCADEPGSGWLPVKIVGGTAVSALICLPSLYIFACLGGADLRLAPLCSVLVAVLCLNALLLIGFAPVAWVFSQSTDSVALIGGLHLAFWTVGAVFALRLLSGLLEFINPHAGKSYLRLWFAVFLLVCLQMTTALRPIVGRGETLLPTKKLFFLSHWGKNLSGETE